MEEEVSKVNLVSQEEPSMAEREEAVLESAIEQGIVSEDLSSRDPDVHRVDFRTKPISEDVNTVEQPVTDVVETEVEDNTPVLDTDDLYSGYGQDAIEETIVENTSTPERQVETSNLPEDLQGLVKFMEETGGTLEDYVRLSSDYSNVDELSLLREFYKQTKSHLDAEDIEFLIEDKFSFDEDYDDEKEVKKKRLAMKEELVSAKKFLNEVKDKYYQEVKGSKKFSEQEREAIDFYQKYSEEQDSFKKTVELQSSHFLNETKKVFDEFKGFEFKVGDKEFKYNVKNPKAVMEYQSDVKNFIQEFLDENQLMKDAKGYHKALFAAKNADTIANHFYEQGKADMLRDMQMKDKNIDMGPRGNHTDPVSAPNGMTVRSLSSEGSSRLRIKK